MPLRTQAFKFSTPKTTTFEVAIINIKGTTIDKFNMSEQALQRIRQVEDANRHRLVHAVYRKMLIPEDQWADAIEARGILVAGFQRPWDITIGTLQSADVMKAAFGDDLKKTVSLEVKVEIFTDIKKNYSELLPLEVEVGAAGQWQYFNVLGRKGRVVHSPGSEHGVLIDMILDQNPRTYPYHDSDWQEAAKFYGVKHIKDVLVGNAADAAAAARISVDCFAVSPCVPLNTNVYLQEAKGLALALHIKGVQFEEDETEGFGLTPVVPIPLKGLLLTGEVQSDQLTPTVGMVEFRIRAKCFKSAYKIQQGKWLAPILVQEMAAEGEASGVAPKFDSVRTLSRRMDRKSNQREVKAAAVAGGKRRAEAEDGEVSDGGASNVSGASSSMSKLAKRAEKGFNIL